MQVRLGVSGARVGGGPRPWARVRRVSRRTAGWASARLVLVGAALLTAAVQPLGCAGGGGGGAASAPAAGPAGDVSVVVMDVGPSELRAFDVAIEEIAIVPLEGPPLRIFPPAGAPPGATLAADLVDLLKVGKTIAAANVPAGIYTAFDLSLGSASATRRDGTALQVQLARRTVRVVPSRPITVDPDRPQNVWMDFHLTSSLRQIGPDTLALDPVLTAVVSAMPVGLADLEGVIAGLLPALPGFELDLVAAPGATASAGRVRIRSTAATVLFDGAVVLADATGVAATARLQPGARIRLSGTVNDTVYTAAAITLLVRAGGATAVPAVLVDGVVTSVQADRLTLAVSEVVRDARTSPPGTAPATVPAGDLEIGLAQAAIARAGTGQAGTAVGLGVFSLAPGQRAIVGAEPGGGGVGQPALEARFVAIRESVVRGTATTTPTGLAVVVDRIEQIDGARALSAPLALDLGGAAHRFDAFVEAAGTTLAAGDLVTVTGLIDAQAGALVAVEADEPAAIDLVGTVDPALVSGRQLTIDLAQGGQAVVEVLDTTLVRGLDDDLPERLTFTVADALAFLEGRAAPFPVEARGLAEAGVVRLSRLSLEGDCSRARARVEGQVGPGAGDPTARALTVDDGVAAVRLALASAVEIEAAPLGETPRPLAVAELFLLLADPSFASAVARADGLPAEGGGIVAQRLELDGVVAPGFGFPAAPAEARFRGQSVPGAAAGSIFEATGDGSAFGLGAAARVRIDLAGASRIRFRGAAGEVDLAPSAAIALFAGAEAFAVDVRGLAAGGGAADVAANRVEVGD